MPRWILGCLFATMSATAQYTTESIAGRWCRGLTGSVYSFLPTVGFLFALVWLPRISQTTARPYFVTTTVVALLSLWPLIFAVSSPPIINLAVFSALYLFNPTFLFAGAITVLLASGVLERARISNSEHTASSSPVNPHGP